MRIDVTFYGPPAPPRSRLARIADRVTSNLAFAGVVAACVTVELAEAHTEYAHRVWGIVKGTAGVVADWYGVCR